MRSNTGMLRKVLVKAIVLGCLVGASVALADGSDSTRPGGGYAEPIVIRPDFLEGGFGTGGGGSSYPMHLASF
jgi:hypothetical protein